jgi:predicted RNA-binding Zn-ribbon protein involved in translation (DUF1610 family)
MTKDDLHKFCATDPFRTNINKPFTKGEYTYATNGHILVRVPKIDSVGEQEVSDIYRPVEPEPIFATIKPHTYHPIPEIPEPIIRPCVMCGGDGKIYICPECDGDGEVHFNTRYNDYACECETCGGDGYISNDKSGPITCKNCDGSGKITEKSDSLASGRHYNNLYLSWLRELPNCFLAEADGMEPGHFKFAGGDGIIMPLMK